MLQKELLSFPLVIQNEQYEEILKHFFPTMQTDILRLLQCVENKEIEIKSLTIFGSSLTFDCGCGSDIDIYIEMDSTEDDFYKTSKYIKSILKNDVDILWNGNIRSNSLIYDEIKRKGYRIYG